MTFEMLRDKICNCFYIFGIMYTYSNPSFSSYLYHVHRNRRAGFPVRRCMACHLSRIWSGCVQCESGNYDRCRMHHYIQSAECATDQPVWHLHRHSSQHGHDSIRLIWLFHFIQHAVSGAVCNSAGIGSRRH